MGCGGSGVIVLPFLSAPNRDIGASCKQGYWRNEYGRRFSLQNPRHFIGATLGIPLVMHKGNASMTSSQSDGYH